jgi:hypothetical protein
MRGGETNILSSRYYNKEKGLSKIITIIKTQLFVHLSSYGKEKKKKYESNKLYRKIANAEKWNEIEEIMQITNLKFTELFGNYGKRSNIEAVFFRRAIDLLLLILKGSENSFKSTSSNKCLYIDEKYF